MVARVDNVAKISSVSVTLFIFARFVLAIGEAGAKNAGLFAIRILAAKRPELRQKLHKYHAEMAAKIKAETLP